MKSYVQGTGLDSKSSVVAKIAHPLDVRAAVDNMADLYKWDTWHLKNMGEDTYIYNGMVVSIKNTPGLYMLQNFDSSNPPAKPDPITDDWLSTSNWYNILAASASLVDVTLGIGKRGYYVPTSGTPEGPKVFWSDDAHYSDIYIDEYKTAPAEPKMWQVFELSNGTEIDCDMSLVAAPENKELSFRISNQYSELSAIVGKFDNSADGELAFKGEGSIKLTKKTGSTIGIGLQWVSLEGSADMTITYDFGSCDIAPGHTVNDVCKMFGSSIGSNQYSKSFTLEVNTDAYYDCSDVIIANQNLFDLTNKTKWKISYSKNGSPVLSNVDAITLPDTLLPDSTNPYTKISLENGATYNIVLSIV